MDIYGFLLQFLTLESSFCFIGSSQSNPSAKTELSNDFIFIKSEANGEMLESAYSSSCTHQPSIFDL